MADFGDTSSYPKAALPVSPLDMAGKLGGLQQQKLQIDQAKLDQANQGLTYMTRAMGALGPDAPKEAYVKAAADAVKMGLVPPQQLQVFADKAAAAPDSKSFFNEFMTAAASHQQQIDYHLGQNGLINRGPDVVPVATKPGQAPRQTGLPISLGQSPEAAQSPQEIFNPATGKNEQGTRGQYGSRAGVQPLSQNMYGGGGLPVERPGTPAPALPAAPPMNAAPAVAQYAKDIADAPSLLDETKPVIQALPLLEKLGKTGIGTAKAHDAIAALTNLGFIDQKGDNYAVNYEIANKKLSQFVQKNGSRSDADLASKAESSPNIKTQLNPALIKLARDAVATNKMKAERAMSFKDDPEYKGNQTAYPDYAAKRSAEQHPDAYKLDTYPEEEQRKIYGEQLKKAQGGNKEAQRFIKSLARSEKAGLTNTGP